MQKGWYRKALRVLVISALGAAIVYGLFFLIISFPTYYPDHTLELEYRLGRLFERISLPIKLARLSLKDPDPFILMPVYGVRVAQVTDTWADPRPDGRTHEGQDIFAPRGTPVFSGTNGYVVFIGENSIGGNSVSIASAGGRRYYYTHLDRFAEGIRVGQEVTNDTVIGFVGNSGNAESTPPHLHLGVYDLRKAIDPIPMLVDRWRITR